MTVAGIWPGPLRLLRSISDRRVDPLVLTLRETRLPRAELEEMLAELTEKSVELIGLLVPPAAAERELGVSVVMLPADLPGFADHLLAPFLHEVVSSPPLWLLEARADHELEEAPTRRRVVPSKRPMAGLDADEVRAVLAGDDYADQVRADRRRATEHGVTGVPSLVIDGRPPVSGVQPVADLQQLLERGPTGSQGVPTTPDRVG